MKKRFQARVTEPTAVEEGTSHEGGGGGRGPGLASPPMCCCFSERACAFKMPMLFLPAEAHTTDAFVFTLCRSHAFVLLAHSAVFLSSSSVLFPFF